MAKRSLSITGKDLAILMGVDSEKYKDANIPRFGHSFLDPLEILAEDTVIGLPLGVQKVTEGNYKSGEVWMDNFYEVMYLYVGKTPEGKDVTIELGGDTPYAGKVSSGIINSDDSSKVFFDRRLLA